MDFVQILITVLIMAVFGLVLGLLAALASRFLSVKKDERISILTYFILESVYFEGVFIVEQNRKVHIVNIVFFIKKM